MFESLVKIWEEMAESLIKGKCIVNAHVEGKQGTGIKA
jgi:hypothetical protein